MATMSAVQPGSYGFPVTIRKRYDNYIGGEWVAPLSGQYFENVTPVTGQVLCEIARSNAADVDRALDAAHAAKKMWGKTSTTERGRMLEKIAQRIEDNLEMLATVETWDNGKPIREEMAADMPLAIDHFRYFAGVIRAQEGSISEIDANTIAYHYHEPLGVIGLIIPWNFPILMATWKLAPALAAGNCVVLKPAEQTPLSILVLMELIQDILPPGVVNIVNGFGLEAGKPLASSPRVNKIAFTGETTTGRLIMQYASQNLIPVTLELGGKSPNVVFGDVDLDKAIAGSASAIFFNHGQCCCAGSRLYVEKEIFDKVVEGVSAKAAKIRVGPGLESSTDMGPLVSQEQLTRVCNYLESGFSEGAKAVVGGSRQGDKGYFVKPTVLVNTSEKMKVVQEEIFGPVVTAIPFKDPSELVALANDTVYGLAAGIWTRDIQKAHRLASQLRAGTVWINCYNIFDAALPFGGYKQSGWGREMGHDALEMYTEVKAVCAAL